MIGQQHELAGVGDGRYRIEETIGQGASGCVLRATEIVSGRPVALKVLLRASATAGRRFIQEARLLQALRHPNVVALLDASWRDDGPPYLAMELLQGRSLAEVLGDHGPLPEGLVVSIACRVLDALEATHNAGIVHRDIKPANIFICGSDGVGTVKLVDFGVAKISQDEAPLSAAGEIIGTPRYMAPEQGNALPVDGRTDLYALGLVMAEMIGGKAVVDHDELIDVLLAQTSEEPLTLPIEVRCAAVGPVIERAISKDKAERFGSARQMRQAIAAAVSVPAPQPKRRLTTAFWVALATVSASVATLLAAC